MLCSDGTQRAQHWLRVKRFRLAPKRERFRIRWKKTTRAPTDVALLRQRRAPRHARAARRGAHTRRGRVRSGHGAADRFARPGAENRRHGRRTARRASQQPRGDRSMSPSCLRNAWLLARGPWWRHHTADDRLRRLRRRSPEAKSN